MSGEDHSENPSGTDTQSDSPFCVYCARRFEAAGEGIRTDQHLIPEVLGGFVAIPVTCKRCNNLIGNSIEGQLKKSPYIVKAIDELQIQTKAEAYRHADPQLKFPSGHTLKGRFGADGNPKVFTQSLPDGSIMIPNDSVHSVLAKQIERFEKQSGQRVKFNLSDFDELPFDRPIFIPEMGLTLIKHRDLGNPTVLLLGLDKSISFRLPAKIAFEHLAGLDYSLVFEDAFNAISNWILNGGKNRYVLMHTPLGDMKPEAIDYRPFHWVRFHFLGGGVSAIVMLFGVIKYLVFLGQINVEDRFAEPSLTQYCVHDIDNEAVFLDTPPTKLQENDILLLNTITKCGVNMLSMTPTAHFNDTVW